MSGGWCSAAVLLLALPLVTSPLARRITHPVPLENTWRMSVPMSTWPAKRSLAQRDIPYWPYVNQLPPSFDPSLSKNVTALLGQTVYLHCIVHNLGDKTVLWIRKKDFHLLTVGLDTYTMDNRFQAIHMERTNDWTLRIKYIQMKDAGIYECQVSSDPKISFFVHLRVVVAKAAILGPHPLYVKTGSAINLTCIISQSPELPVFVFWYQDDRMINYDSSRASIDVYKTSKDSALSRLYIHDAVLEDSGNYTCCPSNTDPTSITVYVLNGERPAAIQHEANTSSSVTFHSWPLLVVSYCLLLGVFRR